VLHALDVQLVPPSFPGSAEAGLDESLGTGSLMFLQQQHQVPGSGTDGLGDFSFGGGFDQELPKMDGWQDWESYLSSMDAIVKILHDSGNPA